MPDEKKDLKPTRREFLKEAAALGTAVVGTGALAGVLAPTPTEAQQPAFAKAIGYVEYNPAHCTGCLTCMAMCSLFHEGEVNPEKSRIQITAPVLKIFEAEGITCHQCTLPECALACPAKAIVADPKTGARVVDPAKCVGLGLCVTACPQYPNSAIRLIPATKKAIKCDLCGGDPQCVKFCPKSVALTPHLYPEKDRVLKFVKNAAT